MSSQNGLNFLVSGYNNGLEQWTTDNDDGVGFGPVPIIQTGPILTVAITNAGSLYNNGTYSNVPLQGGSGVGALATVVIAINKVDSVVITSPGTGYLVTDTLTVLLADVGGGSTGSGFVGTVTALTGFLASNLNLWQFDIGFDSTGGGVNQLIAHPSQNLNDITSTINTRPLFGVFGNAQVGPVGIFTASGTTVNGSPNVTFASINVAMGPGVSISGQGVPSGTTIVSSSSVSTNITLAGVAVTGTAGQFSCSATTLSVGQQVIVTGTLTGTATGVSANFYYIIATNGTTTFTLSSTASGAGIVTTAGTTAGLTFEVQLPSVWTVVMSANATASATRTLVFDNNVSISGGLVMLHPYLFVYGNYGLIKNCSAGNFNDWTSADSNETSVSTGKVIRGLPLRGGTTSPAGLFWTTDSVVRVSYSPSSVGGVSFFWRYDLLTSQSSIMSSQCIVEYDGIFFWCGVDRFLMYNGVVQEVPNTQNLNWFFDNVNFNQRQKVWCTKVPRWGEIWWFYPRGDATECTDAIIYNVRDKCWYDAGEALGARRSAGTFSEVFRFPVWGGTEQNSTGLYTLWQHETGTNQIYLNTVSAIDSFFETPTLGAMTGLVGSNQGAGDNLWTRCERVEPDFVQSQQMYLIVTGKGYADDTDQPSDPYYFDDTTLKVDMREQRREMRLRFGSNTQNGNYFAGKILLSLESGDVRGTGNP